MFCKKLHENYTLRKIFSRFAEMICQNFDTTQYLQLLCNK